ncbi:hypothetical protein [Peijinzhouia sedimentorum]
MLRFANSFRIITLVIFLASLIYSYAAIPGDIVWGEGAFFGLVPAVMSKSTFFFTALITCILINLIFIGLIKNYDNKLRLTSGSPINLRIIPAWLHGLAGWLNTFFVLIVFYVGFTNSAEEMKSDNYDVMIFIGPILILLWFFYLPVLLMSKKTN